jgi:HJR/Mrr/RecB family endonuclease
MIEYPNKVLHNKPYADTEENHEKLLFKEWFEVASQLSRSERNIYDAKFMSECTTNLSTNTVSIPILLKRIYMIHKIIKIDPNIEKFAMCNIEKFFK